MDTEAMDWYISWHTDCTKRDYNIGPRFNRSLQTDHTYEIIIIHFSTPVKQK